MYKTDIFKELTNRKKILEERGYKVIYIELYGSQNYNLSDEQSDIDVKAIILPTLQDIIFRKVTSPTMFAREYRTFDGSIPKKDLDKFPILKQYEGKDISYIVSESVEIL